MIDDLRARQAGGGRVEALSSERHTLALATTPSGKYALAQLDDYMHLHRGQFPHRPPLSLQIEARVSATDLPGTWGFGFWNDPFSAGFGAGGMRRILPVLPNAAWFFYGSEPNHLSLRNDVPGSGFHAKVFRSPLLPSVLSLLALPTLPFFLWPLTASVLRRFASRFFNEDAVTLETDVTAWHQYQLNWQESSVEFLVDGRSVFNTTIVPRGKLGLVIWIDNQYFKFTPEGKIGMGFLPIHEAQSMDIQNLTLGQGSGYD